MKYTKSEFNNTIMSLLNSWDFIAVNGKNGITCYAPGDECTFILTLSIKELLKIYLSSKDDEDFETSADEYIASRFKESKEGASFLYTKSYVHQITMEEITNGIEETYKETGKC